LTTHLVLVDLKKGCGKKSDLEADIKGTKDASDVAIPDIK
jgi:hypothetical protein